MNDLIVQEKLAEWQKLKALVLDSVSSPITRRVYNIVLNEFMAWFQQASRPGFTKATVSAWRVSWKLAALVRHRSLLECRPSESSPRRRLTAGCSRRARRESRVKSVKSTGIRVGNWLSQRQAHS
jgi:hypothetical protein